MVNFESFQTMGMAQQEYRNNRVNSFSAFVVEVENYLRVGTPFDRLTAEHVAIKLLQVPRVRERIKDEWVWSFFWVPTAIMDRIIRESESRSRTLERTYNHV